jgi:hypothetical protein
MSALAGLIFLLLGLQAAGSSAAPAATGQITGVVISADGDASPVRRAIVTISGGGAPQAVSTVTDDAGRFAFSGLAAGRYSVAARKAAYLPAVYGAPAPGKPGTPVLLAAGDKADIRVPLARGAVIAGTVRDTEGNPVSAVPVYVAPASTISEQRRLTNDATLTDDRGAYRVFGLPPDDYLVMVAPRVSVTGSEMVGLARSEVDARLRALEQRHGSTGAAGRPPIAPMPPPSGPGPSPARSTPVSIAPVFHPGTPIAANAARVRAGAGEERTGVDIVFAPAPVATVSGTIQQTGGIEVTRIRPDLTVVGPPVPVLTSGPSLVGPASDGSFSFINVTPGRYTLLVRTGQGASMALPDGRGSTTTNPGIPSLFAMTEFEVDGRDVSGLTMVLQPLPALSGRIEFAGRAKPPANLATVQIVAQAVSGPAGASSGTARAPLTRIVRGTVAADAGFSVAGLLPGSYALNLSVSPAASSPWRPRSAIVSGRDLLDGPFEVAPGGPDISGVVITFTDERSELAGTLSVPSGQTADRYAIVVFAEDKSFWRAGARRLRTVRPAPDGAFAVLDLPAGDYLLAAVDNAPPEDWQQASFLEQLAAASVKVTIRDGAKTVQDIRIAK